MTTATEQGNTCIQQDGSNQRSIGDTSQAFNAALKTPCRRANEKKKKKEKCYLFILIKCFYDLNTIGNSISIDRWSQTKHIRSSPTGNWKEWGWKLGYSLCSAIRWTLPRLMTSSSTLVQLKPLFSNHTRHKPPHKHAYPSALNSLFLFFMFFNFI